MDGRIPRSAPGKRSGNREKCIDGREKGDHGNGGNGGFPGGALDAVERAFSWLCTRPHPVTIDGRAVAGLPAAPVPLDELRQRLLDPATPPAVRERVWAHLIRRARTDGPTWTVACAGMALPLLAGLARDLTARFVADPADIHAEIVAGFLAGLAVVDPDRAALVSLRWAAYRAGLAALTEAMDAPRPVVPDRLRPPPPGPLDGGGDGDRSRSGGSSATAGFESSPPPRPPGHPDLVLARAVADGVLTHAEAALIGSTRLEPVTLVRVADVLGLALPTVTSHRYRAERRLLSYLTDHPAHHSAGPDTDDKTDDDIDLSAEPGTSAGRGSGINRDTDTDTDTGTDTDDVGVATSEGRATRRGGPSRTHRRRRRPRRRDRAGARPPRPQPSATRPTDPDRTAAGRASQDTGADTAGEAGR